MFKRFLGMAAALAFCLAMPVVQAQAAWPERPVKFLLGSAAGSSLDSIGRVLGQKLSEKFNQPFVATNVTGGGLGALTMTLKNSPADGYTIAFGNDSFFTFNALVKGAQFKPDDFEYLAGIFSSDPAWICAPDKPWKNLREAFEWAKEQDKPLLYMSMSRQDNMMTKALADEVGCKIDIIPAKGPNAAITALMGGHCDLAFSGGIHYEQERAGNTCFRRRRSFRERKFVRFGVNGNG